MPLSRLRAVWSRLGQRRKAGVPQGEGAPLRRGVLLHIEGEWVLECGCVIRKDHDETDDTYTVTAWACDVPHQKLISVVLDSYRV